MWPRDCNVFSKRKMVVEQPHFDDERTLLRARPVVPLEKIEAKVKHRRRWFLGSAFAVAMLLGAASALVSAYFKLRNASEPARYDSSTVTTSRFVRASASSRSRGMKSTPRYSGSLIP